MFQAVLGWLSGREPGGAEHADADRAASSEEGSESSEENEAFASRAMAPPPEGHGRQWRIMLNPQEPAVPRAWDTDTHEGMKRGRYLEIRDLITRKGLPPELSHAIFALAGEGCERSVSRGDSATYMSDANVRYIRTPQLASRLVQNFVMQVIVDVDSHDQGWSSDPNRGWVGTYQGSHTWWDLTLDRPVSAHGAHGDSDDNQGSGAGSRHESPLGRTHERSPTPRWDEVHRAVLARNLHASSQFRRHTATLGCDAPIVRDARPGDCYSLWARTQYPGWTNTVRYGRISVLFNWDA
ncbi:hypothetical protein MSPP1_003380 [Malassezia sp. CBS 17886]|nr:hypothetical protein MSPP1_003380 [Malassezia sp. CBS 17886]